MSSGLSKNQRNAMLAEELGDGTGEVTDVIIDNPPPHPPPAPPDVLDAPGPPTMAAAPPADVNALIAALVQGIQGGLSNAAAMARDPIPENKTIAGFSVYSHPLGEAHNTKLRCPMFLGVYDEEGRCKPAFEIYADTCTEKERVGLNELRPGTYPGIERNDGMTALWRVVQQSDDNGNPIRLVIAVPQTWLSQSEYQHMPGQLNYVNQLNAQNQPKVTAA